jgi:DNA primase
MGGVQNVVAPQGTAFTDQHARILKRYVDEVVLCFDSDEAGQSAAVRSLDHLLASGLAIRVAVVPAPHDPDSFIKANGGGAFRRLVEDAEGFFDYYLNRLCKLDDVNSDKGRNAILRGMAEAVHKTGNVVLVDKKIPAAKAAPGENETEPVAESETSRPSAQEFWFLKLLLLHDELVAWATLHLDVNWIQHPLARQIVEKRLTAQTNKTWRNLAAFLDECESSEMRGLVTEAVAEDRKLPNPDRQLADVVTFLRNQFLDRQIAASIQRASQPQMGEAERLELLREQQTLRQQKRAPLK